jgi:hypothetical protein
MMVVFKPRWIFQWIKPFILPGQNWVTRQLGQGQMGVRLSALPVAIRLGGAQATSVYIFIKYVYVYVYVFLNVYIYIE